MQPPEETAWKGRPVPATAPTWLGLSETEVRIHERRNTRDRHAIRVNHDP